MSRGFPVRVTSGASAETSSARGVGTRLEHLPDDVLGRDALHPQLRAEYEPVRERRHGDGLDVVRDDEVASLERGSTACELEEREAPARARAHRAARRGARRDHEVDAVFADALGDVHALDGTLHRQQRLAVDDRAQLGVVGRAVDATGEHVHLSLAARIPERRAQEEAVELRLGERIRPLVLDRVLRRDHEERRLEPMCRALDRRLALLHRLEERRLGLRRSTVDLVREEEVGEDRPRPELEVAVALVPDRRAGDVRGHEVGGELDAREAHAQDLREGPGRERLREARVVLEQDVPVREEPEQHELE